MRSSSSRNLASQLQQQQQPQSGIGGQQRIPARACRATHNPSGEKFVAMQIMQALLFATRISFLMYDVLHAIVHKVIIYDRIGHWFGGSAAASEKLYTLSLGLIAIFLLATIIFAFIYNYMLVHENLYGIGTMAVFLVVVLVYNLIVFARYTSVLESSVICVASSGEIVGVIYLLALIKHKKQVRYVERYDKQFSGSGPDDSQDNKLLPHQRRLEHQMSTGGGGGQKLPPPPPSITISFGSESEEVLSLSRIDENSQQERDEENQGQTSPYSDFEPDRETEGANSVQDRESRQTQEDGDDEFSRYKEQSRAKHRHHHNKDKSQSQLQQQSQQPPPPSQSQHQPSQSDSVPSAKSHRSKHKPSRELERESESTNSLNESPTANTTAKQQSKSTRRSPKQSSKHLRQQSRDHLTVPSGAAPEDLDDQDDLADSQMDNNNTEQASSSLQELSAESGHRSHRSHHTSQDNQSQDNLDQQQQQQQHSPPSSSGHKRHSRRHHRAQQKSIDSEAPPSEVSPDSPQQPPPSAIRTTVKTVLQDEYVYGEDTPTRGVHGPSYHHDDYDYQTQTQPQPHHQRLHHHLYSTNSTDLVDQPYQQPPVANPPYQQPPLVRTVPTNYDPLNHHYRPDQALTQSQHPDYRFDSFYNQYQQPDQFQYGP